MNLKPCNKFINSSKWLQYWHICLELYEVLKALLSGDTKRVAEELMDVQVACETMRVVIGIKDRKWTEIKLEVMRKNIARGYYSEVKK